MSERERAIQLLDSVPEYKLGYVIAYLQGVTVGEDNLNEETLEAFEEVDKMKADGRGDTVSLAYEEYKRMKARIDLLETLTEAENDVKNGRVAPVGETFDNLKNIQSEEIL